MRKVMVLLYGLACYGLFLGTFLYAIGFVGNLIVPKTIDSGVTEPVGFAVLINALLLGVFAIQHSGMARHSFKVWWTRIIPSEIERSTYVLLASLSLLLLYWQWRPILDIAWKIENQAVILLLQGLFWLGWGVILVSTMLISHFDLFGLRQVWLHFAGKSYTPVAFQTPVLYRLVRHPIYLGFLLAFWSASTMTAGHLMFSAATTGYIFIGIMLEERDMLRVHGEAYAQYRRQVSMILPAPLRKAGEAPAEGKTRAARS